MTISVLRIRWCLCEQKRVLKTWMTKIKQENSFERASAKLERKRSIERIGEKDII